MHAWKTRASAPVEEHAGRLCPNSARFPRPIRKQEKAGIPLLVDFASMLRALLRSEELGIFETELVPSLSTEITNRRTGFVALRHADSPHAFIDCFRRVGLSPRS